MTPIFAVKTKNKNKKTINGNKKYAWTNKAV